VGNFQPFLRERDIELVLRPSLSQSDYDVLTSSAHAARKAVTLARSTARSVLARPGDGLLMVHRLVLLASFPGVDPPGRIDVYDFDDDLMVGSPAHEHRRFQWLKREARRAADSIKRARAVIAANDVLAERALALNPNVQVIPSCVDPTKQAVHEHSDGECVTIGWIGSHTTVGYLAPILPVIAQLNDEGLGIRLVVVGGDTGVRADWIDHRAWTLATQSDDLASFDIGIMPLPDTDWTRGKSGYKILQYFAAGVPAIASPVGLNAHLVSDERGLLAVTPGDWRRSLTELTKDVERRRTSGAAARTFVEREYSYQRWAPDLAALFRSLV
jgi:glycosyltransferase involved in cell wall biosynthesis